MSNTEAFRELIILVANNATKKAILEKGMEIKAQILKEWHQLGEDMQVLDSIIKAFAPDQAFPYGWETGRTPSRQKLEDTAKTARIKTVIRLATEIAAKKKIVTTAEIADRLVAEGDSRPRKNIMVSVGNILAKSEDWVKMNSGEYANKKDVTKIP